jgi:hypothetical protein
LDRESVEALNRIAWQGKAHPLPASDNAFPLAFPYLRYHDSILLSVGMSSLGQAPKASSGASPTTAVVMA